MQATLMAVGILTFVLVLGNVFTRMFDLLVNNDVPISFVVEFVVMLIPFSLVFTLPWGLLTAVILVFGRMSADSELVAVRAGGISLATFCAPVLLLAVACSMFCMVINFYLAPEAQLRIKSMVYRLASESPTSLFEDDSVIDQFPGKRIYVGTKTGNIVENMHVWDLDRKDRPVRTFRAAKAEILADEKNNAIVLKLYDARMENRSPEDPENLQKIQTGRRFEELPLTIPLNRLFDSVQKKKGLGALNIEDLFNEVSAPSSKREGYNFTPMLTEIQKRVASSLSCLTFVLVGIPLAIRSHRRETSVGVVMSFGVVFAYYFLTIVAETFKARPAALPELIIWLPNILFQVIGLVTLIKVCRQ